MVVTAILLPVYIKVLAYKLDHMTLDVSADYKTLACLKLI